MKKSERSLAQRGFDFAFATLIFDGATEEREDRRIEYGEVRISAVGIAHRFYLTVVYTDRIDGHRKVRRIISARRRVQPTAERLGITKYRVAKEIGVPAQRIGEIVAGRRAITADTDLRLCRFFGLSNGYWLRAQAAHDTEIAAKQIAADLRTPNCCGNTALPVANEGDSGTYSYERAIHTNVAVITVCRVRRPHRPRF